VQSPRHDALDRFEASGAAGGRRVRPTRTVVLEAPLDYLTGQMLPALNLAPCPSGSRKLTWTLSPFLSFDTS
jgi:hypothetical protein